MNDEAFATLLAETFPRLADGEARALIRRGMHRHLADDVIQAAMDFVATDAEPGKISLAGRIAGQLKRAAPTGTISPAREKTDPAMHPVLAHMVQRLRHEQCEVPEDPKTLVATYWVMSLNLTAGLLGFVPEDRFDGIYRDVMTVWHDDHERAERAREWLIGKFADRLDPPTEPTNRQVRAQCLRKVTEKRALATVLAAERDEKERAGGVKE